MTPTEDKPPISFRIGFGALTPTIAVQIKSQGLKYNPNKAKEFEKYQECLTTLRFAGLLPDSALEKARKKLYRMIVRHVKQINKIK